MYSLLLYLMLADGNIGAAWVDSYHLTDKGCKDRGAEVVQSNLVVHCVPWVSNN